MESDREWDDIEVEVSNQFPQHRSALAVSEVEGLYQVVPLATGRTLGMTLRPWRGGCDGKVVMMVLRVVKAFFQLRVRIFGNWSI